MYRFPILEERHFSMNIYILLLISLVLFLVGNTFYVAVKKYEEDEDFARGVDTFSIMDLILGLLLSISRKFSSHRYHNVILKFASFLLGVFILGLLVLSWRIFTLFE